MSQIPPARSEQERLLRKLASIAELGEAETRAVLDLPLEVRAYAADQEIVHEGDRPDACCLVLSGLVCAAKALPEGRRQILSFFIPGDIPDLESLHLPGLDRSIGTLVPTRVAFIAHPRLHELLRRHPGLVTALWRETLIDAAIYREWMVNLGRRAAGQRLAHMICEMDARFAAVGLNHAHSFELPLTQMELGDALGLSAVHVNRVLQELRGAGLLDYDGGRVTIRNWEGLKAAGEFDPAYLHLRREPA